MKEEKLQGFFCKAANGRQCYEIDKATPEFIYVAANFLVQKFGFSEPKKPIVGLDEVLTECSKEQLKLLLGWDNWSGFYVLADTPDTDAVVNEFGRYLDSVIHQPEFDIYVHIW
jgi:hypothetical protein